MSIHSIQHDYLANEMVTQNCAVSQGFTLSPQVQGRKTPNLKKPKETFCCNGAIFLSKYIIKDIDLVMQ